jgi:hypothetical protein
MAVTCISRMRECANVLSRHGMGSTICAVIKTCMPFIHCNVQLYFTEIQSIVKA